MIKQILILLIFIPFLTRGQYDDKNDFVKGFYVDTAGIKFDGYLSVSGGSKVFFKPYLKSKAKKIKLKELSCLSNGRQRLVVLKDIKVKAELALVNDNVMDVFNTKFDDVLTQEIIYGKIKLYRTNIVTSFQSPLKLSLGVSMWGLSFYYMVPLEGTKKHGEEFYFVQKDDEDLFQVKTGNKKFREQMLSLLEDNKPYLDSLNLGEHNYYDLLDIIRGYNNHYKIKDPYLNKKTVNDDIADSIYIEPENLPEYIEGKEALLDLISGVMPTLYAKQNKKFGTVFTKVILNDNGQIIKVEVLDKIGYGLDEKAIDIVKSTKGSWRAARNSEKSVHCSIVIPVDFKASPTNLDNKAIKFYKQGLKLFEAKNSMGKRRGIIHRCNFHMLRFETNEK